MKCVLIYFLNKLCTGKMLSKFYKTLFMITLVLLHLNFVTINFFLYFIVKPGVYAEWL